MSCHDPKSEFCPHAGMMAAQSESPASFAGKVAGDARLRVRAAALVALALWGLYILVESIRGHVDDFIGGTALTVGLGSAALLWASTRSLGAKTMAAIGSLYLLGTSFAIAAVEQHAGMAVGLGAGVSWTALWVAFFPLLVPCSPRRTLVKALVAATATPLAFLLLVVLPGRPIPAPLELVALFVPVYVAALMAFAGAKMLEKLGDRLSQAVSVGRYELVRKLGEGGMGEVWEARHRQLARPVALKVITPKREDDTTQRRRFEREARATAALQSPHTVQLYDYGTTDQGQLFYAMELLEGMDLEALIREHGPMPPARVAHVLRQALDSLEEAHARGLVHRDIKPANLHLGRHGLHHDHLKVLDFGLVKPAPGDVELGPTLTADGRISGTPAYLAPETVAGARDIDGRADVYALGCVAYWLLTGKRVFPGEDILRVAVAHVTETPIPPSLRGAEDLGSDFEALIMATLEKDPVRRPDAASLREMLASVKIGPWSESDAKDWWGEHGALPPPRVREDTPTPRTAPMRPAIFGHA